MTFEGTPLAQEIVYNLEKRCKKLLESKAMLNAMYVDPRHLFELTSEERTAVRKDLCALYKRLNGDR